MKENRDEKLQEIAEKALTDEGVPLSLGDSEAVQMGDTVCTAGYPHGEKGVATQVPIHGIRDRDKHFEVKAVFDPGQSGSPLLNRAGEVIGVAVATSRAISFATGVVPPSLNLSYAIPTSTLAAMLAEQYTAALADYDLALERNPDAVQIYFGRADVKLALKDYTGAIEDFDKIISLSPEFTASFNIYARRADAKYRLKDYQGTIEDYSKIIEHNPENYRAYIDRGRVKRIMGDYEDAIADCDQAIQLNSEQHAAYYNRAFAKRRLGKSKTLLERIILYQAAIDDYTEAIKLKPKHANTYYNRGFAKYQFGKSHADNGDNTAARQYYQAAVDDYTETIKIDPKYQLAYHERGHAKEALGQHEEAKTDFAQAKELDPDVENQPY